MPARRPRMPRRWTAILGLAACSFAGCAVVGPISQGVPPSRHRTVEPLEDGYGDIAGVIHVHTDGYSHDADGKMADAIRVANAQGLDYLIITEHGTLQPLRDGWQGRHGAVLVLIGMEISTVSGHYVALNVTKEINPHGLTAQQVIDAVNRQGGFGFIAHPYFKKRRWTDWTVQGFTGIEVYNVAHDAMDENRLRIAMWSVALPADPVYLSILDRPYDPLAKWDELIREQGKIVGIGSTDAHEVHIAGVKLAPYEMMFKMIRTHLLLPHGAEVDAQTVYAALRQGHAYLSIDLVRDARGFTFMADDGRQVLGIMRHEVVLTPGLRLTAVLPGPADLSLFRNGERIAQTTDRIWHVQIDKPGAYRLEAMRHARPWIFSNPIYVKAAQEVPGTNALP